MNPVEISLLDEGEVVKVSLAFLGFLGEDVAVVSMLPLDLSRSGKRETLFGTGVGLKLCHCFIKLKIDILRRRARGRDTGNRFLSFLLVGRNYHCHTLPLKDRHAFGTAVVFKFNRKPQQLFLSLVLEHDGPSAEEYGRLDLGTFLKELLRMLEFELEVMLVGIRTETDLLDDNLRGIGFHFLCLLLLLIEVLLVIEDPAHRRIGLCADLHQVKFELVRHLQRLCNGIYTGFRDILPDQAHLLSSNLLVYVELILVVLLRLTRIRSATARFEARRPGFVRSCDS